MTRFVTYSAEPSFPATDQFGPGTVRVKVRDLWIDYLGDKPTDEEIAARLSLVEAQPKYKPPSL